MVKWELEYCAAYLTNNRKAHGHEIHHSRKNTLKGIIIHSAKEATDNGDFTSWIIWNKRKKIVDAGIVRKSAEGKISYGKLEAKDAKKVFDYIKKEEQA